MTFDWITTLTGRGIPYVTTGANIGKGEIGVRCPFCGQADPSEHLAISLDGRGWYCRRNAEHRGIKPTRLVAALLGISITEATHIVGDDKDKVPSIEDHAFGDTIGGMLRKLMVTVAPIKPITFPKSIPLLSEHSVMARPISSYLQTRDYDQGEVDDIYRLYRLRGGIAGAFRYRLVFPIEHPEGLVSWTGRTIGKIEPRYKALSTDPDKAKGEQMPVAVLSTHECLWQADVLFRDGGTSLVICEGPMDALRVDFYGRASGIRATCLFGKALSNSQILLLATMRRRFERVILLLDNDAWPDVGAILERLAFLRVEGRRVPPGTKDPALLSPNQIFHALR